MLRLKIVKSAAEEEAIATTTANEDDNKDVAANDGGKGTRVLLELTHPWRDSGRLVTADAYFVSVEAALKMKEADLISLGMSSSAAEGSQWRFLGMPSSPSEDVDRFSHRSTMTLARRNSWQSPGSIGTVASSSRRCADWARGG